MATAYKGTVQTLLASNPEVSAAFQGGQLRCIQEQFTIGTTALASADTIQLAVLPIGAVFQFGTLESDTAFTGTIAIGTSTSTTLYLGATSITAAAALLPLVFGKSPAIGIAGAAGSVTTPVGLTAAQTVLALWAGAASPTTVVLTFGFYYTMP